MTPWSYSGIKTFDQCPKKYFHLKVAKDVVDYPGPEAVYGVKVHKAAEDYMKDGTPVPDEYSYMRPILEKFSAMKGTVHTELRMGVKKVGKDFEPCRFGARDVWYRGIADLVVINGDKARVVDYKTGKSAKYADTKQLDLMAGAIFVHFPEVQKVKAALAYVVSHDFIPKEYERPDVSKCLGVFDSQLERLDHAHLSGVWNPISGPLCGWCPVVSCEHNRKGRRY